MKILGKLRECMACLAMICGAADGVQVVFLDGNQNKRASVSGPMPRGRPSAPFALALMDSLPSLPPGATARLCYATKPRVALLAALVRAMVAVTAPTTFPAKLFPA